MSRRIAFFPSRFGATGFASNLFNVEKNIIEQEFLEGKNDIMARNMAQILRNVVIAQPERTCKLIFEHGIWKSLVCSALAYNKVNLIRLSCRNSVCSSAMRNLIRNAAQIRSDMLSWVMHYFCKRMHSRWWNTQSSNFMTPTRHQRSFSNYWIGSSWCECWWIQSDCPAVLPWILLMMIMV